MSDPRDELRRMLRRPSDDKPQQNSKQKADQDADRSYEKADFFDTGHMLIGHLDITNTKKSTSHDDAGVVDYLGGLMTMASNALSAAVRRFDD